MEKVDGGNVASDRWAIEGRQDRRALAPGAHSRGYEMPCPLERVLVRRANTDHSGAAAIATRVGGRVKSHVLITEKRKQQMRQQLKIYLPKSLSYFKEEL